MLLSCRLHRRAPAVSALLAYPGSLGSRRGAPALALQSRSFRFWGSGKGDSDKDKEGAGSDNASTIEAEKTSVSGELITPATIGTGDHAPRYPKLIGLPVLRRPLFPGTIHPYNVTNPDVLSAIVKSKEEGQPYLGVFLRKDASVEHGTAFGLGSSHDSTGSDAEVISSLDEIYGVGTFAQVYQVIPGTVGTGSQVLLLAHRRLSIKKVHTFGPPLEVEVEHWARGDASPDSDVIKAYCQEIVATIRDVVRLNPLLREHMAFFSQRIDIQDPYKLADFAAAMTTADSHELQQVLEEMNVKERLRMALELISKERELSKVQQEIQKQVEEKVSKTQRTFLLQEQLKSIRKELGMEKDDKEALLNTYRERMASFTEVNKDAERAMKEEIEKLESLEKNSQEFNGTRTYLDWLTSLPWGRTSEENFDLARAKDILNREHYGLDDVKRRILEFIAVGKLRGGVHGRILCFVGPPGVGKTSINQSIARALNREFYRFSVGGLTDVASIKGHRRTYVGSQPGKMIQCLKTTGTNNPLVLIDEIDKLGKGYQGDPASALLEVLDPSQNDAFVDHYLDVPVDLSQVRFLRCQGGRSHTLTHSLAPSYTSVSLFALQMSWTPFQRRSLTEWR
jgi:Lon-like ATP-dependent protease